MYESCDRQEGLRRRTRRSRWLSRPVTKQPFNVVLIDIHEILQTEVNFMVMSHNCNVIIITILQASLHHEGTDGDADDNNE